MQSFGVFSQQTVLSFHSERDQMKPLIVFFVAFMLQHVQGKIGKFLSPVSTRSQIYFLFALQTNVAFILKMSLFQFGFSRKTRKENDEMPKQAHYM